MMSKNDAPDLLYILYKYIIVFNHFKNELTLVEMLSEGEESGLPELEAPSKTGIMLLTISL